MLPMPLLLGIFRLLPLDSVAQLQEVCKLFSKIIREDYYKFVPLHRSRSTSTGSHTDSNRRTWEAERISCTNLRGHKKPVNCLALGDAFLASGGEDKKVLVIFYIYMFLAFLKEKKKKKKDFANNCLSTKKGDTYEKIQSYALFMLFIRIHILVTYLLCNYGTQKKGKRLTYVRGLFMQPIFINTVSCSCGTQKRGKD
eukprot:Phypoly_transcript_09226.p1 GENE.Phypoly_transcript_09226~~Phypoly_transcript_09226.p1  ORF type:complete len:198 (-),score=13.64 Phypoly_transcript_09226:158-751(-)